MQTMDHGSGPRQFGAATTHSYLSHPRVTIASTALVGRRAQPCVAWFVRHCVLLSIGTTPHPYRTVATHIGRSLLYLLHSELTDKKCLSNRAEEITGRPKTDA